MAGINDVITTLNELEEINYKSDYLSFKDGFINLKLDKRVKREFLNSKDSIVFNYYTFKHDESFVYLSNGYFKKEILFFDNSENALDSFEKLIEKLHIELNQKQKESISEAKKMQDNYWKKSEIIRDFEKAEKINITKWNNNYLIEIKLIGDAREFISKLSKDEWQAFKDIYIKHKSNSYSDSLFKVVNGGINDNVLFIDDPKAAQYMSKEFFEQSGCVDALEYLLKTNLKIEEPSEILNEESILISKEQLSKLPELINYLIKERGKVKAPLTELLKNEAFIDYLKD